MEGRNRVWSGELMLSDTALTQSRSNGKRDNRCWKAGVSMMKVLAVMTYFQISLPTHNWDSAFYALSGCASNRTVRLETRVLQWLQNNPPRRKPGSRSSSCPQAGHRVRMR